MTSPQLPERPNLEQLKRQAKDLLRSAQNRDPAALARFRGLPAFAAKDDSALASTPPALHDAQSAIARELGFDSWNALRNRVEELTLDFAAARKGFIEAATDGRSDRAWRVLELHPGIARAGFHEALVLRDVAVVAAALAARPALATERGGPRDWEPLLYLCHTTLRRRDAAAADREPAAAEIARLLIASGADPNARFPWLHHGVRRPALWSACTVGRNLILARALLEAGASPNDGVTLPLAAGGGDVAVLELLREFGGDANVAWASDGSSALYSVLSWATILDGIRWLLDHGAHADPVFPANGETPLHAAARRWPLELTQLLVNHGADPSRARADGRTPYAVAELHGNRAVSEWLATQGVATALSGVDRFAAACMRADAATANALLHEHPGLPKQLGPEHQGALLLAAARDDAPALETMLQCGFDPNWADEAGQTALHAAAHDGRTEAVRVLLNHGASVHLKDREFHGTPLVWAADGARTHRDRDFTPSARLLLAAGSSADWEAAGEEPPEELLEILASWRRL